MLLFLCLGILVLLEDDLHLWYSPCWLTPPLTMAHTASLPLHAYPKQHGPEICRDHLYRGGCPRGPACPYLHVEQDGRDDRKRKRSNSITPPFRGPVTKRSSIAIVRTEAELIRDLQYDKEDLKREVEELKADMLSLREENRSLRRENRILRDENAELRSGRRGHSSRRH